MSFSAIAALDPSSKHRKIKAFLRFSAGASALLSRKNPIIQSFPDEKKLFTKGNFRLKFAEIPLGNYFEPTYFEPL